jgi:hypothetical protein
MYCCLECEGLFEHPNKYIETHGLDTPPYEELYACPCCGGDYAPTEQCELCGYWITGKYVELENGWLVCDDCFQLKNVEDMRCCP